MDKTFVTLKNHNPRKVQANFQIKGGVSLMQISANIMSFGRDREYTLNKYFYEIYKGAKKLQNLYTIR